MKEILIKIKDEKESSYQRFIDKSKIRFEILVKMRRHLGEELKQSVMYGQLAFKSGKADQFSEIEPKDNGKYIIAYIL